VLRLADRPGVHGAQRDLVGVEVRVAVDAERHEQSDHEAGAAAEKRTDEEHER
jgi:hypothetical protein